MTLATSSRAPAPKSTKARTSITAITSNSLKLFGSPPIHFGPRTNGEGYASTRRRRAAEATVFVGCAFPTPAAPSAPLQTPPAPARRSRT
jgi:hypothetical protein